MYLIEFGQVTEFFFLFPHMSLSSQILKSEGFCWVFWYISCDEISYMSFWGTMYTVCSAVSLILEHILYSGYVFF